MLTDRQFHTFALICETLLPALPEEEGLDPVLQRHGAQQIDLPRRVLETIAPELNAGQQREFRWFLQLIETPLVNRLIAREAVGFSRASPERRTAILRGWSSSRLATARKAFFGLKLIVLYLAYTSPEGLSPNPVWSVFHYEASPPSDDQRKNGSTGLTCFSLDGKRRISTEVLVIGSGAGGGVVAAELAAAGHEVLVVEKGPFCTGDSFVQDERVGQETLYEKKGRLTTVDGSVLLLAGSALGGGTTVNWMTSLVTPPRVLEEWFVQPGLRQSLAAQWQLSEQEILARLHVNTEESLSNTQNALLEQGCRALGYRVKPIPRNSVGCEHCNWCGYGCKFDAKQDSRVAFLQDACVQGVKLLAQTHVERILTQEGRATGAILTCCEAGRCEEVEVTAKVVVAAAGAIHTPALLMRSGLTNRHLGRHLHLHPTTAVCGRFSQPVYSWQGAPQTRYCDHFDDLDGQGYGVWMEVCPGHPGLWASALAWQSGREHKRFMQDLHHLANTIVLLRDRHGGRVKVDRKGNPQIHYRLHPADAEHLAQGIEESLRIQWAAGAEVIYSPHNCHLAHAREEGNDLRLFLERVRRAGLKPFVLSLYSAHQMSTCRMGDSARRAAVSPAGETFEVGNLFVADGSVMPTACGVNPMVTIMTLAHTIAQNIKERL